MNAGAMRKHYGQNIELPQGCAANVFDKNTISDAEAGLQKHKCNGEQRVLLD